MDETRKTAMDNAKPDMADRPEPVDTLPPVDDEFAPTGWSRRTWVQREAVAFSALARQFAIGEAD